MHCASPFKNWSAWWRTPPIYGLHIRALPWWPAGHPLSTGTHTCTLHSGPPGAHGTGASRAFTHGAEHEDIDARRTVTYQPPGPPPEWGSAPAHQRARTGAYPPQPRGPPIRSRASGGRVCQAAEKTCNQDMANPPPRHYHRISSFYHQDGTSPCLLNATYCCQGDEASNISVLLTRWPRTPGGRLQPIQAPPAKRGEGLPIPRRCAAPQDPLPHPCQLKCRWVQSPASPPANSSVGAIPMKRQQTWDQAAAANTPCCCWQPGGHAQCPTLALHAAGWQASRGDVCRQSPCCCLGPTICPAGAGAWARGCSRVAAVQCTDPGNGSSGSDA
jgi:hypothetical protein